MQNRTTVAAALAGMLLAIVPAAGQEPPAPAGQGKPRVLKSEHMQIDLANRKITIDAAVALLDNHDYLEFVLSGWGEKTHESLLHTKATGKQIHFGLLMLGLQRGIPPEWIYVGQQPHFLPPRGPKVDLSVRWTDKKGKQHDKPVSAFIKKTGKNAPEPPETFVFIGSEVLVDGAYWADQNGELISVSNFASAVLDVPFRSSDKEGQLAFMVDRKTLPKRGTAVQLILTVQADAAKSPYARAMIDIDPDGQLAVDGQALATEKLEDWAGKLSRDHPQAKVVVRPDPKARMGDVQWVLETVRLGGIFDTEVERLRRQVELPRTAADRQRLLNEWAKKFSEPAEQVVPPATQVAEVLPVLRSNLARQQRQAEVLQEYIEDLTRLAAQHAEADEPADEAR